MDFFEGRTAIVTGGASGIGRAVGGELARRGALVTLADINAPLVEEAAASLARQGYKARPAALDVSDHEAVRKLVNDTVSEHGRLDYMFNNAGIAVFGETQDFSYDDWHRVIDINLYGVVHGIAAAYPVMVKQGSGHIVNTASLAGLVPAAGEISYTASKYAIVGVSDTLRAEGKKYGVKSSVVCPGFIRTPIYETCKLIDLEREKIVRQAPKGMDPVKCARIILRGVERNKAFIVVTFPAKILWYIQRLSPGLARALFGEIIIKAFRGAKSVR
ncbi:MAG: SDR family NAD(P)-dependent oxidoreductase [Actinobacteria bacterium]|nr:SDR family NAD(P)-dependent oxidoreductase [Actinomycetota bacterium]